MSLAQSTNFPRLKTLLIAFRSRCISGEMRPTALILNIMADPVDQLAKCEPVSFKPITRSDLMVVRSASFPVFGLAVQSRSASPARSGAVLIRHMLPCYRVSARRLHFPRIRGGQRASVQRRYKARFWFRCRADVFQPVKPRKAASGVCVWYFVLKFRCHKIAACAEVPEA